MKSISIEDSRVFGLVALGTAAILSVPLVAMQFTEEVDWQPFDFLIMGTLLFGMGSLFVLTARRVKLNKWLLGIIFLALTMAIWAEMAVGLFTSLGS